MPDDRRSSRDGDHDTLMRVLDEQASLHRLLAAAEAEWISDGEPAPTSVQHALTSACHSGYALGIAHALELVAQAAAEPTTLRTPAVPKDRGC
jgi:hypothetical protein